MPTLSTLFQDLLDVAPEYSSEGNDFMDLREVTLKQAREVLAGWLEEEVRGTPMEGLDLRVQQGGRQANFGPVPWIRIFSPSHSPRTTEGFYVVYLFGGTGQKLYVSLNQGTSEYRAGKVRPVKDPAELTARAAGARAQLSQLATVVPMRGALTLDLEVSAMKVGPESKQRVRNYELANVYGTAYKTGAVPDDAVIRAHLREYVSALAVLYGEEPLSAPPASGAGVGAGTGTQGGKGGAGRGQGRLDPKSRRAVEELSMRYAEAHYDALGWSVLRVHLTESFDLRCTRGEEELHVECKGTIGAGEEVILTRGEVVHARQFATKSLFVVCEIELDRSDPDAPVATGGRTVLYDPWDLDEERLTAFRYTYRVV